MTRDQTPAVRAALAESEGRYGRLLNRLSALVFDLEVDGTICFVSDAVTAVTGYSPEALTGKNWWSTFLPGDDPDHGRVAALIDQCRAGDVSHFEIVVASQAGTPITLDLISANRYEPDGSLARIICMATDVSDPTRPGFTRGQADAQFRALCALSMTGVFLCDAAGSVVYSNAAYEHMTGRAGQDLLGSGWLGAIHADDRDAITFAWEAAVAMRAPYACSGRYQRGDGTIVWFTLEAAPIVEGARVLGFVGMAEDTTREKRQERELRAQAERHDYVQNAIGIGVWEQDLTTGRVTWSDTMEGIHGLPSGAFPQTFEAFLVRVHPDDRPALVRAFDSTLKDGAAYHSEYRNIWPDRSIHWIESQARVMRDAAGRPSRILGVDRDITERKLAELTLVETEQQFRAVFEGASDAIVLVDDDARYVAVNAAACSLFGMTAEDLIGRASGDFAPPDAKHDRAWRECLATGHMAGEYQLQRPDGQVRDVEFAATAHVLPGRHLSVLRDVTERKRNAEERDRLATVLEHSLNEIYLFDSVTLRFEFVNEAARANLGYSLADLRTMTPLDIKPPFDVTSFQALIGPLLRHEKNLVVFQTEHRRANGTRYPVEAHLQLVHQRGEPLILAIILDVTDRKEAQVALTESERAYQSTFEAGPAGIAHVGLDGRWLRVNQRLCDLLGYVREELLSVDLPSLAHPDEVERDVEVIPQLTAGTLDRHVRERRYRRRDGTFVWTMSNISLHRDAAGQPQYFIAIVEDITERRTLEAQFRQAQKMEAVGQLAGGVAHDFNNMLTAILGFSELILAHEGTDNAVRADVGEIVSAGNRAATLTRQLLAFSRKQKLDPQILDLNAVVGGMEGMLRRLIGAQVKMVTRLSKTLGLVNADRGQIEQVLVNLALNARDAMPAGGTLTVETGNVDCDAAFVASRAGAVGGPHVAITIRDTGVGMDEQVLAHLFEPFFTTKELGKGTGLGLATVYGVVKQSDGFILVDSQVGHGSNVAVYLPHASQRSIQSRLSDPARMLQIGTESILLVEDQPEVSRLATEVLTRSGYSVTCASNGDEAVRIIEGLASFHLLLTDVVMPGMGGRDVAKQFVLRHPGTPVLYMSGYTEGTVLQRGDPPGEVAFLQKPFTPRGLLQKVRDVLGPAERTPDNERSA